MTDQPFVEQVDAPDPLALAAVLADEPHFAWLDTARPGGPQGRYSLLAAWPRMILAAKGDSLRMGPAGAPRSEVGDPLAALQRLLADTAVHTPDFPLPFAGGVLGYFGYDLAPWTEPVALDATDDVRVPDMYLGFHEAAMVYDHADRAAWLVRLPGEGGEEVAARWCEATKRARSAAPPQAPDRAVAPGTKLRGNFTYEGYVGAIASAKEYIAAGDIYQVNLSQRFSAPLAADGWSLYLRLRQTNPAPVAAYLRFADEVEVLSSSPERFLRLETDGFVETRPIKGTVARGATPEEDRRLADVLRASVKDRAELLMIIDLERNDLGKVCEIGTVRVPDLFALESYETVHHLVATVHGRLREGNGPVDLLRATFPGGSITGAPKIRSMQIIDELEPTRRAVYTGAIGYISAHGRMDLNIAIRTFIVRRGEALYQVGGGIVADSDPHAEYVETLNKGRGLAAALAEDLPGQLDALASQAGAGGAP
jgi:para-aminobenzoate synthetase component 1